nr:hypothetical protein [Candidatus Bathyarchaeota archaeon]
MAEEEKKLARVVKNVFKDVACSHISPFFYSLITLHLKKKLADDPYEVALRKPASFYSELEKTLSGGVEVFIYMLATKLVEEYNVDVSPRELLTLLREESEEAKQKLKEIWVKVASEAEKKLY